MSDDSFELTGLEIKPYISSQMNCRTAAAGYVMEAINSHLTLDLSSFPGVLKATVIFSRISGNGKVKINNINIDVLSKSFHQIDLDVIHDKILYFLRDENSIGKIVITKIILINTESEAIKLAAAKAIISTNTLRKFNENWRNVFMKFGNVRGIKLVDNKIYASEASQVLHANIIELIETDPPNSFVISNIIKFIYPCEITSVYFKNEFEISVKHENKYKHFTKPPEIESDALNSSNNIINKLSMVINNMNSSNGNIIYDSLVSKLDVNFLINCKDTVNVNGKNDQALLLKREAQFSISMFNLKSNKQYTIVANLKKISGNGKFGVAIITSSGEIISSSVVIAPNVNTELYIKLNTNGLLTDGDSYSLKIFRPDDSTVGDVLLERLMILQDVSLLESYNIQNGNVESNLLSTINKNKSPYTIDYVRSNSKKYKRLISHNKTENQFNHAGNISLCTKSSISWFNKISPLCPNIKNDNAAKIVFSELGSLIKAETLLIEPFEGNIISDKEINILKNANRIILSSVENFNLIKAICPNKCQLLEKVWPSIEPTFLKYPSNDYFVMFYRSKELTDKIVERYDSRNNPPLVIIGAIEEYPDFVIPMNEYVSYDKIIGTILNAKLLIDIPDVLNYISGIISLAIDSNVPVLTSNKFYLNNQLCNYISDINDINIQIINALKNKKINTSYNHNEKFNHMLSVLFEIEAL